MSRSNKRSIVWNFYLNVEGNKVKCKFCPCTYKHFNNTSNLMMHLKRKHPVEFLEASQKQSPLPGSSTGTSAIVECVLGGQSGSLKVPSKTKDSNSTQIVEEPAPKRQRQLRLFAPPKVNQAVLDNALMEMIALDHQPFQIVENIGFKKFTQKLNPDYVLPTRKLLSDKLLDDKYKICFEALKQMLNTVEDVALTTDIWTSDSNRAYLSVTAHFINSNKLNSFMLNTAELPGDHTSEHIAEELQTIFEKWQIINKIVSIVTDNASTMKKAVKDYLNIRNHYCVAHTLNLAVKDCLTGNADKKFKNEKIVEVITKCRNIVTHFKHSSKSTYKLIEIQKQMGLEILKLKQDVPTRWNATLVMMERMCKLKVALSTTLPFLNSPPSNLESSEWDMLDDFIMLLKPFEKMTTILSGELYPTMSSIIPLIRGLQSTVMNKVLKTQAGLNLKDAIIDVIQKRLNVYESNRSASKATFLDPRLKKKAFGLDSNAENAQKWVTEELAAMQPLQVSASLHPTSAQSLTDEDDLWHLLDKEIATTCTQQTSVSSATTMVKQYLDFPYLDRRQNPLEFWEERKHILPLMYKLAKKYLCIPATSVPSERLFSKAGMVTNERRNRLLPKKLDALLFLNCWIAAHLK